MDEMAWLLVILGGVGSLILMGGAVLLVVLVRGPEEKTTRRLGARPANCPVCAHPVPPATFLRSITEALWGNWSCAHCQDLLDRHDRDGGAPLDLEAATIGVGAPSDAALLRAIGHDDLLALREALEAGAYPDLPGVRGLTPLMEAAFACSAAVVQTLISAGASVSAYNAGTTALMCAARTNNHRAARVLIAAGAQDDERDTDGQTALTIALELGSDETAELIRVASARRDRRGRC